MHVSLSGGGARGLVYAAFFERVQQRLEGKNILDQVKSFSGVSAGALVATPLAMGVPAGQIFKETQNSGVSSRFWFARAIATLWGWRKGLYSTDHMYNHLCTLCTNRKLKRPISIAVTDNTMSQKCLLYKIGTHANVVSNCAAASAAVPAVFAPRHVSPLGLVIDGGAVKSTFPVDAVTTAIRSGENVMLFYSGPWPAYRIEYGSMKKRYLTKVMDKFNEHGLEWIQAEMGTGFKFKDGIFKYRNVTFVAPTGAQYRQSNGTEGSSNIFYKPDSKFTKLLRSEGYQIADDYILKLKQGLI